MGKVTMTNAQEAMDLVWNRWKKYIPSNLSHYRARDIFRFHDTKFTFDTAFAFALTFASTFKKANDLHCPADNISGTCGGFVTPTQSHEARLIHIHPENLNREFDPMSLLAHEYIHFLSHPNFYPKYYKVGGQNPFRVEGATEWLTMQCFSGGFALGDLKESFPDWFITVTWFHLSSTIGLPITYAAEFEKTKAWIDADSQNLDRLLEFVFKGKETDLSTINI